MQAVKAKLMWRGQTFSRHAVDLAAAAQAQNSLLVQGAHPLGDIDLPSGCRIVSNAKWQDGPFSSLQSAIHALIAENCWFDGILLLTCDRPHVLPSTVSALANAWRGAPDCIAFPRYLGQSGHPLILPRDLALETIALPSTATLRNIMRKEDAAQRRLAVKVEDPAILDNIDTPSDYARLLCQLTDTCPSTPRS